VTKIGGIWALETHEITSGVRNQRDTRMGRKKDSATRVKGVKICLRIHNTAGPTKRKPEKVQEIAALRRVNGICQPPLIISVKKLPR